MPQPDFSSYQLFMIFFVPISTGIVVSFFGIWASRKAKIYYEGWQKYNDLRDKNDEAFKLQMTNQYNCLRQSIDSLKSSKADRGELEKEAQELKTSLEKEAADIRTKLDRRADSIWERVNNHEHGIECDGAGCTARKTNGVISNPLHLR